MKRFVSLFIVAAILAPLSFAVPPGSAEQIRERLQPVGEVCRVGEECGSASAAVASGPLSGQQVYDQFCFACHMSGVGGAPLFADAAAWEPRVSKGMDVLMDSTINGINAMPAKGTCVNCSDEELTDAVQYMLDAL